MSMTTRDATDVWEEVQDAQLRATGGFLERGDVKQALQLLEKYAQYHESCTAVAVPTECSGPVTRLEVTSDSMRARRGKSYNSGISVEFDFRADDDPELFTRLKDEGFNPYSKRKHFADSGIGTDDPPEGTVAARPVDLSGEPTEETLVSLFKINKHARKYADGAHGHYQRRNHYSAGQNSVKKEALYGVKGAVLSKIADRADKIERHKIGERTYLCLYFGTWSFHSPTGELNVDPERIEGETEALDDFEKTSDVGDVERSLKNSLIHLNDTFGVNANDHLPQRRVGDYFAGWTYLG